MTTANLYFYHKDDSKIVNCITEIKAESPVPIINVDIKDIPESDKITELKNVQKVVTLRFNSSADCDIFRQDRTCFRIYQKWSR
jgi:hypothetical protein